MPRRRVPPMTLMCVPFSLVVLMTGVDAAGTATSDSARRELERAEHLGTVAQHAAW